MAPFSMCVGLRIYLVYMFLCPLIGDAILVVNIFTKGRSSTQGKRRLTGKTTMESKYSGFTSNGEYASAMFMPSIIQTISPARCAQLKSPSRRILRIQTTPQSMEHRGILSLGEKNRPLKRKIV
jgi:hypothetical protein